ncbi:ABC-three component system middle component 1 [Pseudoalteromonas sp. H105]|uniref:ABC-three component system middle component 1 n=1 Tax=Pseudoalteromonas sp. H105 TaxID=1348393 RepID=UPI000731FE0F|nr:ABC-three component system middle component 1 [Pseudoalteromonas sp. H105]KTF14783.1 hypothetical protein ATS75_11745 [Pseudoalteromonas sp. H105]
MSSFTRVGSENFTSIEKEFSTASIKHFAVNQNGAKLRAFYCHFETISELSNLWLQWISFLASEYFKDDLSIFEKMNIYVLFSCNEDIPKSIQFSIENNKFAVRKLIYDKSCVSLPDKEIINFLDRKILSSHINIEEPLEEKGDIEISKIGTDLIREYNRASNIGEVNDAFFKEWLEAQLSKEI